MKALFSIESIKHIQIENKTNSTKNTQSWKTHLRFWFLQITRNHLIPDNVVESSDIIQVCGFEKILEILPEDAQFLLKTSLVLFRGLCHGCEEEIEMLIVDIYVSLKLIKAPSDHNL